MYIIKIILLIVTGLILLGLMIDKEKDKYNLIVFIYVLTTFMYILIN